MLEAASGRMVLREPEIERVLTFDTISFIGFVRQGDPVSFVLCNIMTSTKSSHPFTNVAVVPSDTPIVTQ